MNKLFYMMCYGMAGIGLIALFFSVSEWWGEFSKSLELSKSGISISGTVIGIDDRESLQSFQGYWARSRVYDALVTYKVGGEVQGKTYESSLNDTWVELQTPRYEVGQTVSILYSSRHPEVSCLNTWSGVWKMTLQRSLVLLTGLSFLLTLFLIPQNEIMYLERPVFVFPAMSLLLCMGVALLYQGLPIITESVSALRWLGIFMTGLGGIILLLIKAVWAMFRE
ncbi:MAG: hypothetical protein IPJ69_13315 [Deltaproteobacteria bacterium]|nr:MAG: hypothetical protein IPJ69_13315 [Deltaproteobacteria bacterium]